MCMHVGWSKYNHENILKLLLTSSLFHVLFHSQCVQMIFLCLHEKYNVLIGKQQLTRR